jgi:uncharacterized protein
VIDYSRCKPATGFLLLMLMVALPVPETSKAARPEYFVRDFPRAQLIINTRGGHGCVLFDIYVAQSPAQRAQGLMHIEAMGQYEGMIFLSAQEERISMWMKNTLISLDMLFVDKQSKIVSLHAGAVPLSETIIDSGVDAVAVIELNAGSIEYFGIETGNRIIFPAG